MNSREYSIKLIPQISESKLPKCLKTRQIIVFGCGENGKYIIELALGLNYHVIEIWDNYLQMEEYDEIKVSKPNNFSDKNIPIIITVVNQEIASVMYDQAKSLGYLNILSYTSLFLHDEFPYEIYRKMCYPIQQYRIQIIRNFSEESVVMNSIDYQITDKCSLKCKECANLMQYYTYPKDFGLGQCIADIDKILSAVDYIHDVRVIGGEPFVCRDFYQHIEHLKKQKNIGLISVFTNGTIVPTGKNLDCLKAQNIILSISDYGKLSRNLKRLVEICEKERILYVVKPIDYWTRCASFEQHNRTDEENRDVLKNCCVAFCPSLRNHRLFRCPFLANAWALKAIPQNIIECVDLNTNDIEKIRKNIQFLFQKDLILGCDYCLGRPLTEQDQVRIPVAEQINHPIEYIRYDEAVDTYSGFIHNNVPLGPKQLDSPKNGRV